MKRNNGRVIAAMSGGVDSSVAAALLIEKEYEVTGITMEVWDGEAQRRDDASTGHGCYGPDEEENIEDTRKVAQVLGIPLYTYDLRQEYRVEVMDYFRREYLSGRTPNPCVRCNRSIKFDALVEKARDSGLLFDYFATGHYARVEYDKSRNRYLLKKAIDTTKDQSYFLFSLSQEQLRHTIFPLGCYTKVEVRRIARTIGLAVADKPESQDFIAGGHHTFIETEPKPGPVMDRHGNTLGQHPGIAFYTIGQRKGLGISSSEPLYVTGIDQERNTIIAGTKKEVYGDELIAFEPNWIAMEELKQPLEVKAKIRYRHSEAEATVTPLDEVKVRVKFREPQMAITPGQAVVFYDGDVVVGGGTIEQAAK